MQNNENIIGSSFGRWTVQNDFRYVNRQKQWLCVCSCGTVKYVNEQNLRNGKSQSCGCISVERTRAAAKDLTGQTFGSLTAIKRAENKNGRVCWECRCQCGNTVVVSSHQLCSGKTKSCGCLKKAGGNRGIRDISDQNIGFIKILYPTDKRDKKGSVFWHCCCSRCGQEIDLTEDELIHGNYKSCGCYKKELQSKIGDNLHFVDSTCVEWLENRKHRCDNTSGFRGVTVVGDKQYKVNIGFRKQRYYLGYYDTFEKAVQARLAAEDVMHDAFVNEYKQWEEKSNTNKKWAEEHPFTFSRDAEIEKMIMAIKENFGRQPQHIAEKKNKSQVENEHHN